MCAIKWGDFHTSYLIVNRCHNLATYLIMISIVVGVVVSSYISKHEPQKYLRTSLRKQRMKIQQWVNNNNNNNNAGIHIALYPKAQSALQYFVAGFTRNETAYLGANCSHTVHNLIRVNSRIHRCPQNRISDKRSHRGLCPLLFPNSVWVL